MAFTLAEYKHEKNIHPEQVLTALGGRIITSFSDTVDLTAVALELTALTTGTLRVSGADGEVVDYLAADLVAMNNKLPFTVKRIHATGTTVTRCHAVV